ncbi:MAG: hypothetical protein ACLP9L_35230 [Thermoguttaceae bacterium]
MLLTIATLLSTAGCLSSSGPGGTSGGLADLIPGHQEAALRKRVEADSFPSADQALHGPPGGDGNRTSSSN